MHAWLTVQMLWQMHGRTLQAVHMLIVCMVIIHHYVGIAQDCAHRIVDCAQREYKCAHIVLLQHSVTTHSWLDCTLIQVSYLQVEEVYLDHPIRYDRCSMSCLHARGISDLPMGNGLGLQRGFGDVFRAVISAFSMSGESRIACLSCLRATTLRSHRN